MTISQNILKLILDDNQKQRTFDSSDSPINEIKPGDILVYCSDKYSKSYYENPLICLYIHKNIIHCIEKIKVDDNFCFILSDHSFDKLKKIVGHPDEKELYCQYINHLDKIQSIKSGDIISDMPKCIPENFVALNDLKFGQIKNGKFYIFEKIYNIHLDFEIVNVKDYSEEQKQLKKLGKLYSNGKNKFKTGDLFVFKHPMFNYLNKKLYNLEDFFGVIYSIEPDKIIFSYYDSTKNIVRYNETISEFIEKVK